MHEYTKKTLGLPQCNEIINKIGCFWSSFSFIYIYMYIFLLQNVEKIC